MMLVWIPLLVALVGLVVYALATNPKAAEVGRILFFSGVFVTLWLVGARVVKFS